MIRAVTERVLRRNKMAGLLLAPLLLAAAAKAQAEPVPLDFAYFSSDRSTTYLMGVKPFVDAVNQAAAAHVRIDVHPSGALGQDPRKQLDLVLDGTADFAFIIPGYTPGRFPDVAVIELPGLFNGIREATTVFTRMMAEIDFRGFEELYVVAAYATEPETIHTRAKVTSLADLDRLRIRVNNPIAGAALARLGMVPVPLPVNKVATALGKGDIDGATVPPAPLVEFGISRIAAHHYMLGVSATPLAIVMRRDRFAALPLPVQAAIASLSGQWAAERYIEAYEHENKATMEKLAADPRRAVTPPSAAENEVVAKAFAGVAADWAAEDARHAELLSLARQEIARLRAMSSSSP